MVGLHLHHLGPVSKTAPRTVHLGKKDWINVPHVATHANVHATTLNLIHAAGHRTRMHPRRRRAASVTLRGDALTLPGESVPIIA